VDLIHHIINSDKSAFEKAFLDWQSKVYYYFISRTRDDDFAEELTQMTFIKLWEYREGLSTEFDFDTQLFRIARTVMIDAIRERERRKRLLSEFQTEHNTIEPFFSTHNEAQSDFNNSLNDLPAVRKKVFVLNRLHGFSYKEIAATLNISDRTVEKHISLALKQLKRIMTLFFFL
jgi:RNA polymerase sigma-70 factor (ECF subfamily)